MQPHTLVSLWSIMERFKAQHVVPVAAAMSQLSQVASTGNPADEIPLELKGTANRVLAQAALVSLEAGLIESADMAARLSEQFETPVKFAELQHAFYQFMRLWESEAEKRQFFVLDKSEEAYFGKKELFGLQVFASFPSARNDIEEAGNCFALGRYSASVHHSMCALEPGLGALAANVGVVVGSRTWKTIIDLIEKAIKELEPSLPSGPAKNARLQFLSEAAKEFFYFKEGWRNHVAHARAHYDREQALSVLNHAKAFMQTLAGRLLE
jgi:hypothetical protein